MTNDELLNKLDSMEMRYKNEAPRRNALRAVVELHRRDINEGENHCRECYSEYPCPTIQAIEKELG
jgi:hypothetical protein